ncbi:hypothetical protein DPEC_G00291920 [Dallia pectoralis]|uniref:Uncharacterized protein n=1 Tax=Dallia pectoralis TaxID=75939 RepID=A0ACC2FHK7_DALPE|nr:hypothetical protein DPEC_G00291920 [Dallia pectoralis]
MPVIPLISTTLPKNMQRLKRSPGSQASNTCLPRSQQKESPRSLGRSVRLTHGAALIQTLGDLGRRWSGGPRKRLQQRRPVEEVAAVVGANGKGKCFPGQSLGLLALCVRGRVCSLMPTIEFETQRGFWLAGWHCSGCSKERSGDPE